jgi:hypothetical protein
VGCCGWRGLLRGGRLREIAVLAGERYMARTDGICAELLEPSWPSGTLMGTWQGQMGQALVERAAQPRTRCWYARSTPNTLGHCCVMPCI